MDPEWMLSACGLNCAEQRAVNICYECPDFICSKLEAVAKDGSSTHHRTVENLKEMKKKGLDTGPEEACAMLLVSIPEIMPV